MIDRRPRERQESPGVHGPSALRILQHAELPFGRLIASDDNANIDEFAAHGIRDETDHAIDVLHGAPPKRFSSRRAVASARRSRKKPTHSSSSSDTDQPLGIRRRTSRSLSRSIM